MSVIEEKTSRLFTDSWESDDDLGYPNDVAFVAGDRAWAEDSVAEQLIEGIPTVLVGADSELLLIPDRPSPIDRLRRRTPVTVALRVDGRPTPYAAKTHLGRRPLSEMGGLLGEAKARSERRKPPRKTRRREEQARRDAQCRAA